MPSELIANPGGIDADCRRSWGYRHRFGLALAAITLLGGVLRFSFIERPSLWGDEAATFSRISGTYRQMLERLEDAGFPPFHYQLYWWIAQHTTPTPFWMRLAPAVSGTLFIPAMYFLARRFVGRKTSLLAAGLAASSAYLLVYSRDAKMYMEFWLFAAVHVACAIAWFRDRRRIAWWAWIVSGIAMLGFDSLGLALLPLDILFYFTQEEVHWRRTIYFAVGLGIILAGPIYYYLNFNKWVERSAEDPHRTGITWVEGYNEQRDGVGLAAFTGSAYLMGWEWTVADDSADIPAGLERTLKITVVGLYLLVGLALLPWPGRWMARDDDGPDRAWRSGLWLMLWLAAPSYVFYRLSMPGAARPGDWGGMLLAHRTAWIAAGAIAAGWMALWIRGSRRGAMGVVVAAVIVLAVLEAMAPWVKPYRYSILMPRYLGFVWPALGIVLAALLMRLPTRGVRWTVVGLIVAVNLVQFRQRLFAGTEPPQAMAAADVLAGEDVAGNATRTYSDIPEFNNGAPAMGTIGSITGRYYLCVLSGKMLSPGELRLGFGQFFQVRRYRGPGDLAADMKSEPALRRVIVWRMVRPPVNRADRMPREEEVPPVNLVKSVPAGWRLTHFNAFAVYDHWKWRKMNTWYRWEYERMTR